MTRVYSIYDEKAYYYRMPFFCASDDEATRILFDAVRGGDSQLVNFPGDFSLYFIGEFNEVDGVIVSASKPSLVLPISQIVGGIFPNAKNS